MKKFLAVLLVAILVLGCLVYTVALAEAAEAAPGAPLVDLTRVVIAVLVLIFEFLLAWIAKVIVPPIKKWLDAHVTEKEKRMAWDTTCALVDAAEQIIKGPGMGTSRLNYVEAGLQERGLTIDTDMIEAAVRRMKERTMLTLADGLGIKPSMPPDDEEIDDDYPLPPLEEWPLEMIVDFCKGNGIACAGCQTKEEYIQAIIGAAKQTLDEPLPVHDGSTGATTLEAARAMLGLEPDAPAGKDYTELDENGEPVPEGPESVNE